MSNTESSCVISAHSTGSKCGKDAMRNVLVPTADTQTIMVVVGANEMASAQVSLRSRDGQNLGVLSLEQTRQAKLNTAGGHALTLPATGEVTE